nr:MAG TPA: hypothetical protein [Caudoviricetes sp.]
MKMTIINIYYFFIVFFQFDCSKTKIIYSN